MIGARVRSSFSILALLIAASTSAFADVTWDVTDVGFTDGAKVTGSFTTNANTVTSYNVFLTMPGGSAIQAVKVASSYLPTAIGFAFNQAYTEYVDLVFSTPMTSSTKTLGLLSGSAGSVLCPTSGGTCFFMNSGGSLVDPPQVPEPAAIMLLGTACGLVFLKWGRRKPAPVRE